MNNSEQLRMEENLDGFVAFIAPWSGTYTKDFKMAAEAFVQLEKILEQVDVETLNRFAKSRIGAFKRNFIHINKN